MAIEMALTELEDRIADIVNDVDKETFIFDFMREMGLPKATVTKLQKGQKAANIATVEGDIWSNKNVYFRKTEKDVLSELMDVQNIVKSKSGNQPRIILVTDFQRLVALDTKISDTLDINFLELPQNFDFFLPWQGRERVEFETENPADIKAAERFAKIYDVLFKDNTEIINVKEKRKTVARHVFTENTVSETAFNNFLIRILFALFAEDTDIFPRGAFTSVIKKMTDEDGSDMNMILRELFGVLDKPENVRGTLANWLSQFPYVNGSLFTEPHEDIVFSAKSRKLIIDAGELIDWTQVNPDIFGSMVQAVTGEDDRSHLGMHYTSVPNIMKVIKPLFLDDLNDQFEAVYNNAKELDKLNDRMSRMKFFDPAAGSGNFLIITYKELRRLEIKIMKRLAELTGSLLYVPIISLKQFYGIEIEEFATDVAKVSLWIAEHQMNVELRSELNGVVRPTLPLQNAGAITTGNSTRIDWDVFVELNPSEELFVFGNPPYLGAKKQKPAQKEDMEYVLGSNKKWKKLDYITAWFALAERLISKFPKVKTAFVSTNSITQGEQVGFFWPDVLSRVDISFAYTSFKWGNNASGQAGVTVVIIGLSEKSVSGEKWLYLPSGERQNGRVITPYLTVGNKQVIVLSESKNQFGLPEAYLGNLPLDGGNLIFSSDEYSEAVGVYPELEKFFRVYLGGDELLKGRKRYILWLDDTEYEKIKNNPVVEKAVGDVKNYRESAGQSAKTIADRPWAFFTRKQRDEAVKRVKAENNLQTLVIPRVSSENRKYIPMSIVMGDTVMSDSTTVIYNPELWLFGLLESQMHMVWMRAIGGKLETRYRYSGGLVYNTFPVPVLSQNKKEILEELSLGVLDAREEVGGTLSDLYDQEAMPTTLKEAHEKLDKYVDSLYKQSGFSDDVSRLAWLLKLYVQHKEG